MSLDDDSKVLFTETQQVRQKWVWCLAVGIPSLVVIILILNVLGHDSEINSDMLISLAVSIALVVLISYLLWHARLDTVIDLEGLTYRFAPFHRSPRHIAWNNVSVAVVRQYRPIVEYGGWGLRWGFSGLAYNVFGNMGLQIKLRNGRRILIGTQKPEEIERAVAKLRESGKIPATED